ncbi:MULTISPECIES: hypothetical protein [Dactylosporangium]|uniref:Uncharacterized protein n=2 Tax=Dactylosporangium TaxID=35753 RepID=A0A9W6KN69_9ACTN|nr:MULTISPECIES: hypothetical protein [Dactylosporangium]UAB94512.1 hypothetical protein Dvina_41275 [Dactylosporangium vinaceum]UWZ42884.1 hypothetical protein Dmats_35990 [Dactylosporangium matsuzakiense]GLL03990.1 hypothetical protein GCM10017581_057360 [Dactylosporangium matsuzakiense]
MPRSRAATADEIRRLARRGELAVSVANADSQERHRLVGGTYSVAFPVVYSGLTRGLEKRRGHNGCAISVRHLTADCLDRFQDDVEAVVHDVVRRAVEPIADLDAWIGGLLTSATVDGHRRRRGAIGALQRPRPPKWLVAALGGDRWLVHLSVQILVWAGHPSTAGAEVWPTSTWAEERSRITGDWGAVADVHRDIDTVLRAMRTRPAWYERYVEGPLGHKRAPVPWFEPETVDGSAGRALDLVGAGERDEVHLQDLAHEAMTAIQARLRAGEDAPSAVADVVELVFGSGGRPPIDRLPLEADLGGEHVTRMMRDRAERDRITAAVLAIVADL